MEQASCENPNRCSRRLRPIAKLLFACVAVTMSDRGAAARVPCAQAEKLLAVESDRRIRRDAASAERHGRATYSSKRMRQKRSGQSTRHQTRLDDQRACSRPRDAEAGRIGGGRSRLRKGVLRGRSLIRCDPQHPRTAARSRTMAHLQRTIVKQQCETYVLALRFCMDCERFRHIQDYTKHKIQNGVWLHRGQQPTHPELQALLAAFL